jgi:arsenite methyltransferase
MDTKEINVRYSILAEDECCLSCGGAVDHAKAKPGEFCADLGSGRGTDVLRMAEEVGEKGKVYGIDTSDGMIRKSQKQAKKLDVSNVEFVQSDLEKIAIPENHLNLIISNCTINHVQNKQAVWNEVFRMLKPGGRFVVSDIYALQPVPEEHKNDPVAVSECWAGAVTRREYMDSLQIAGFSRIKILEESTPYDKGKVKVSSFTVYGEKPGLKSCCS